MHVDELLERIRLEHELETTGKLRKADLLRLLDLSMRAAADAQARKDRAIAAGLSWAPLPCWSDLPDND